MVQVSLTDGTVVHKVRDVSSAAALLWTATNLFGGEGTLKDPEGFIITPDQSTVLTAGTYVWGARPVGQLAPPVHSTVPPSPESLRPSFACISRLYWGSKCVGTAFRVKESGLIIAARHCCLDGTKLLHVLGAFDAPLDLLATFPAHDLIVFKGKPGPCLQLATAEGRYGFPGALVLASYPEVVDKSMELAVDDEPTVTAGQVAQVDSSGAVIAATYEGLPNSSGAPVLRDSTSAVGMHLGTFYHREELQGEVAEVPPDIVEIASSDFWAAEDPAQPNDSDAAQEAHLNISHKSCLSIFLSAPFILQLLQRAKLVPLAALGQSSVKNAHSARTKRKFQGSGS